ncbi:hypothetical protein SCHPADRAFT_947907 [Schizopora paradoxa]|uniref:Uncharacterized protein n=1 Tax=Schizopora paradoxa TaxID=27342 RepID=A0A0H2QX58_9AGAM|nr:hypothetical protein SCHPADRAFT_947907 [Schizopora paradoxa]
MARSLTCVDFMTILHHCAIAIRRAGRDHLTLGDAFKIPSSSRNAFDPSCFAERARVDLDEIARKRKQIKTFMILPTVHSCVLGALHLLTVTPLLYRDCAK